MSHESEEYLNIQRFPYSSWHRLSSPDNGGDRFEEDIVHSFEQPITRLKFVGGGGRERKGGKDKIEA